MNTNKTYSSQLSIESPFAHIMKYTVARGEQILGEFSCDEIINYLESGDLIVDDLVYKEGFDNWRSISETPELNVQEHASSDKSFWETFKSSWSTSSAYGKAILVSAGLAILSMFMNWVETGLGSANGIQQMAFLFLGFYVYPCLRLLKGHPIKKMWGIGCGVGATLSSIWFIESKTLILFGESINVSGSGPVFFLLCSVTLIVGVIGFKSASGSSSPAERTKMNKKELMTKLKSSKVLLGFVITGVLVVVFVLMSGDEGALGGSHSSPNSAKITDLNFEKALNEKLFFTPDGVLHYDDHVRTTTSLDLYSQGISNIEGIQMFRNLESVNLNGNKVSDLSPMAGMKNLRHLSVSYNSITDLSPLAGLTNLRKLTLWDNLIIDLSPLAGLKQLTYLELGDNPKLTRAEIDKLNKAQPNLKITHNAYK